jgi:hypothetical protein
VHGRSDWYGKGLPRLLDGGDLAWCVVRAGPCRVTSLRAAPRRANPPPPPPFPPLPAPGTPSRRGASRASSSSPSG